jgi:hypothetical protein
MAARLAVPFLIEVTLDEMASLVEEIDKYLVEVPTLVDLNQTMTEVPDKNENKKPGLFGRDGYRSTYVTIYVFLLLGSTVGIALNIVGIIGEHAVRCIH